jgi:16S rRNA (uracil1498-N3)-methyltransferase
METIIQKSVELGAFAVVPVFTARSVVIDDGNFHKKIQRWQKISNEAVKQCRRGIIPRVREAMTFQEMLDSLPPFDLALFPYENETERTIKEALRSVPKKPGTAALIIGPEGGFSDGEARALVRAGAVSVSLGKTVLRTETAGMAAIAMTMYELEL